MNATIIHVCRFSSLDEIPKSYSGQRYRDAVVKLLAKRGRFSCFEVDPKLSKALDVLKAEGRIEFIHDESRYAFPWTGVKVKQEAP